MANASRLPAGVVLLLRSRSARLVVGVAIGVLTVAWLNAFLAQEEPAALVLEKWHWTFLAGEIESEQAFVPFRIKNRSSSPLRLRLKSLNCGCLAVHDAQSRLNVGGELVLEPLEVRTLQLVPKTSFGAQAAEVVAVFQNDRVDREPLLLSLRCQVRVVPDLQARPSIIMLSPTLAAEGSVKAQAEFSVTQYYRGSEVDAAELAVAASPPGFHVTIRRRFSRPANDRNLMVRSWSCSLDAESSSMPSLGGQIILRAASSHGAHGEVVAIPVALSRESMAQLPTSVGFGIVSIGQHSSRHISITPGRNPFRILSVSCDHEAFSATCHDQEQGKQALELQFVPRGTGRSETNLTVITDNPAYSKLAIKLSGVGR